MTKDAVVAFRGTDGTALRDQADDFLPPCLRRVALAEGSVQRRFPSDSGGASGTGRTGPVGQHQPGLSASAIPRPQTDCRDGDERWSRRDPSARRHVCFAARSVGSGRTASVSPPEAGANPLALTAGPNRWP